VTALARGLDHPRWVYALPNGDVLVVESNKPPKPDEPKDGGDGPIAQIKQKVMGMVMKRAGAGVPSANRITLLRDTNGDGVAEVRQVFMQNLVSPFGVVLVGNELFIANADALVKVPYTDGQTSITATPTKVTDLPAGINHHWTKNVIANREGTKLYVTVGSNSNIGENGLPAEEGRAAIWEVDVKTGEKRLFASGLRNPNGMGWEPDTNQLWTVVNERDEIGSDLVPDYLTSVKDGAFYGWPWSYYGGHVDARVEPQNPQMVAKAVVPDFALGSHVAPLGMTFSNARGMPPEFANGVFVGEHGSWNRKPLSGYKVVFVPFIGGRPSGAPVDFLTGFLSADEKAQGRPVGVALDKAGALLVADDVGNAVWRVSKAR
jgi:glucose/arabinose dehydrogenase